jgi:predicted metal-dependent hydrolase
MSTSVYPITPRRPDFDWSTSDVGSWVPGNPDATHTLNAMHVLFPEGERAFCRVLGAALTHISNEQVRRDIKGFLAQEGAHGQAHQEVLTRLIDAAPQLEHTQASVARTFRRLLGAQRTKNRYVLMWRLASVAAIEHMTTAIGDWTMTSERLIEHGCDPQMVALVKWHGAEEIEHRSVAFDAHAAVQRRCNTVTRALAMAFWLPTMTLLWFRAAQTLKRNDPTRVGRRTLSVRAVRRAIKNGLVPNIPAIAAGTVAFCRRSYHPSTHVPQEIVAAAAAWLRNNVDDAGATRSA